MIPSSLPLVEVEPRIREYEAYMFWLLGTTISQRLTASSNQTTRLDLRFEYHITEHPLRRQLGGIIGTRRPYEEVTQASLGGSQC